MSNYKKASTRKNNVLDLCTRRGNKPALSPENLESSIVGFKVIGVLNPTYINYNDRDYLIIRVDEAPIQKDISFLENTPLGIDFIYERICEKYGPYISHFRIVPIDDNLRLQIEENIPLMNNEGKIIYHIEDPRVSLFEEHPYILYSEVTKFGAVAHIAEFKFPNILFGNKMILGPDHKHTVLFPEKINGKILAIIRPLSRISLKTCGAWLIESNEMKYWGNPRPFLIPRSNYWDSERTGIAASPIKVNNYWFILYFGVDNDNSYHLGFALSNYENPDKIFYRSDKPILSPSKSWECNGRRADTVFSGGLSYNQASNCITIYYGAADTRIGIAEYSLDKIKFIKNKKG